MVCKKLLEVYHQTLYQKNLFMSNQVYNGFMGRNYFSKYGGPCFINNGFSSHEHDHKPGETHEDIKPEDKGLKSIAIIGRARSLFKSRRKKAQPFFYTKPSCLPSNKEE